MKERTKIRGKVNEPKNFAKAAAGLVAAAAGTAAVIGAVTHLKKEKEMDVYEEVVVVAGDMGDEAMETEETVAEETETEEVVEE